MFDQTLDFVSPRNVFFRITTKMFVVMHRYGFFLAVLHALSVRVTERIKHYVR